MTPLPSSVDTNLPPLYFSCDARGILVLEDIDAAFAQRDGKNPNTLSFSGLLNVIDGVCAQVSTRTLLARTLLSLCTVSDLNCQLARTSQG